MFRKVVLFLTLLFSLNAAAHVDTSHLRISLLTCGPGSGEVYEVFGHTAVRIIDSVNGTDDVYNYGMFSYGPGFELQFMQGRLLYYVAYYPFRAFMPEYLEAGRSVQEQELLLDGAQKENIYAYLQWNSQPEHKNYKYDFFFDNCATRIRDIFPKNLNPGFTFGRAIPVDSRLTFRDIMNKYFYCRPWERVGCNLLLGRKIDKVMSNEDIMFLPDYLRDGVAGATVNGRKISRAPIVILPGQVPPPGFNWPLVLTSFAALLTIIGLTVRSLRWLSKIMTTSLLFVTGLLGCLMLVMWFCTDHQACSDNFNILWMLPTNIIIAFFNPKGKGKYALIALILIFVSLILHVFKVQALVVEDLPLMLALLFIFGTIYKRSINTNPTTHYA